LRQEGRAMRAVLDWLKGIFSVDRT
jgi:hypothetical protein